VCGRHRDAGERRLDWRRSPGCGAVTLRSRSMSAQGGRESSATAPNRNRQTWSDSARRGRREGLIGPSGFTGSERPKRFVTEKGRPSRGRSRVQQSRYGVAVRLPWPSWCCHSALPKPKFEPAGRAAPHFSPAPTKASHARSGGHRRRTGHSRRWRDNARTSTPAEGRHEFSAAASRPFNGTAS